MTHTIEGNGSMSKYHGEQFWSESAIRRCTTGVT